MPRSATSGFLKMEIRWAPASEATIVCASTAADATDWTQKARYACQLLMLHLQFSTVANTQQEATLITFTTLLPSIFLSGFFFPVEAMPLTLQWLSVLIPLKYYLTIIRSLLIKGVGVDSLHTEILALAIFGVSFILLAAMRLQKRLE